MKYDDLDCAEGDVYNLHDSRLQSTGKRGKSTLYLVTLAWFESELDGFLLFLQSDFWPPISAHCQLHPWRAAAGCGLTPIRDIVAFRHACILLAMPHHGTHFSKMFLE